MAMWLHFLANVMRGEVMPRAYEGCFSLLDRKRQLFFFLWDMFFLNMMPGTVETWHQPEDEANT